MAAEDGGGSIYAEDAGGDCYLYATTAPDANVLEDDDGVLYLYFAKDHLENGGKSEICGAVLRNDFTGLAGEPVTFLIPDQEWEKRSAMRCRTRRLARS